MKLRFLPGDEDSFQSGKKELIGEIERRLGPDVDPELIADVEMFLDWTFWYGDGRLDRYSIGDIGEYLLDWCPRKVIVAPEDRPSIVNGIRVWIEHLVATDQWHGLPVPQILDTLDAIVPEFLAAMEDGSRFGMGKSILTGAPGGGPDLDLSDPSAMEALIEAFNALSPEERLELTGGPIDIDDELDVVGEYDLPMTETPDPELVDRQAAVAPLMTQIDALREYLGRGVRLTATGNPKLVDAKEMVEVLQTDDRWERTVGGETRTPRSANELPHLLFLLAVATVAGALDNDGKTLAPSEVWENIRPPQQCAFLLDAVLKIGIVSRGTEFRYANGRANVFDDMNEILDDSGVHLLVPAFIAGEEYVAVGVEQAISVVRAQLEDLWPQFFEGTTVDEMIERNVNRAFETFERLGMVELRDRVDHQERYGGDTYRTGGSVRITDLGRWAIESNLAELGYIVHHTADLATVDAAEAVMTLATSETDPRAIWQNWAPDADPVDKFDQLMDVLATASTGPERLAAVALLEQAPEPVQRRVEAMVDGPRAAYALMVLDPERSPFAGGEAQGDVMGPANGQPDELSSAKDSRWATDPDWVGDGGPTRLSDGRPVEVAIQELGPERSLAPLVDLLWLEMDVDPEDLIEHVMLLDAGAPEADLDSGAFTQLLGDLWRVDLPETADLLEFLGANHPVKATAKLARKGLIKHRSAYPRRQ